MAQYRNNGEFFTDYGSRVFRRNRRFGRFTKQRLSESSLLLAALLLLSLTAFGLRMFFLDFPCEVGLLESVDGILEPRNYIDYTWFSLEYINQEEQKSENNLFEPQFGGHQTLEEREKSFYAVNQTLHCGFIKGKGGYSSIVFDLDERDKAYMYNCKVAVSSCIFGSSDFLRRPTSRLISQYSKDNVCFVMFLDEQTMSKLSSEGNYPDDRGYIGLWKIVVVKNLPYEDMRRTGKVPKFLSHRLFPNSRYSIWLDSKM